MRWILTYDLCLRKISFISNTFDDYPWQVGKSLSIAKFYCSFWNKKKMKKNESNWFNQSSAIFCSLSLYLQIYTLRISTYIRLCHIEMYKTLVEWPPHHRALVKRNEEIKWWNGYWECGFYLQSSRCLHYRQHLMAFAKKFLQSHRIFFIHHMWQQLKIHSLSYDSSSLQFFVSLCSNWRCVWVTDWICIVGLQSSR